MKTKRAYLLAIVLTLAIFSGIIFVQVPTKQGIDGKLYTYKIPLYIKIIEFIDRDYHYRRIVSEIRAGKASDEEMVLAIFQWCREYIKDQPEGLPTYDDHPLNIIIRGYAAEDQYEDIFTILCTYAGFEAFYKKFSGIGDARYILSFVKIGKRWYPFSVRRNLYARVDGRLASMDDIFRDKSLATDFINRIPGFNVESFLAEVSKNGLAAKSIRVKGQSPMGRLLCILKGEK